MAAIVQRKHPNIDQMQPNNGCKAPNPGPFRLRRQHCRHKVRIDYEDGWCPVCEFWHRRLRPCSAFQAPTHSGQRNGPPCRRAAGAGTNARRSPRTARCSSLAVLLGDLVQHQHTRSDAVGTSSPATPSFRDCAGTPIILGSRYPFLHL